MTAYWLARTTVTDPVKFKGYADRAPTIIARHGGRYLARSGETRILEGAPDHERFFVIAFPSLKDAEACHASADYQEASRLREGAGRIEIVVVEGLPSV